MSFEYVSMATIEDLVTIQCDESWFDLMLIQEMNQVETKCKVEDN